MKWDIREAEKERFRPLNILIKELLPPIVQKLEEEKEDFRLLILPDHPTPVRIRTHTSDPVPYLLYDSGMDLKREWKYNEKEARASHNMVEEGHKIIEKLFEK